jgi:hypothetical protein
VLAAHNAPDDLLIGHPVATGQRRRGLGQGLIGHGG